MNKTRTLLCLASLATIYTSTVFAYYHEEERHIGKLQFNVGWYADPPFAGEAQQVYMSAWYAGRGIIVSDNKQGQHDTHPEDNVDVRLKIQRLKSADPGAKVIEEIRVPGKFREIWEGEYVYGVDLIARKAGPIAVVLTGEINGIKLNNERFVCKSPERLHRELNDGISCIQERKERLPTAPEPIPHFKPRGNSR